ncbi:MULTISPECIES: HD domain-containing protein [Bacillus]|uniref:HD domain-containing protein n=4 Tax=Bacillus cereus group TaxID=86661 RepID=A0AAP4V709_BACTU|nr:MULTISPECIES: HD domain-containing protein [Bacillus]AEA16496.1 putative metal-dependent phosphohydrolase [Bacillus thuringiensis serovar chinensis CT-43]AFV18631.1 putative metal-dependent phosphohydrolase [Bacillus thuringiensis Bt407]AGG01584.1 putative Metal-dependent phosphohydrolase [Bacillus thuringiensis serovar thuringiensis str. IS5056]ARP58189.1 phosphohydrolase [Bacillus thuringiensis]AST01527.1 phosphohydrolase [Bacillus thuringiensis]
MKYILDRTYAKELLEWAYEQNPGPWFEHSLHVAQATENIIIELIKKGYKLDADIAYNAALLHDIGRYKGFTKSVIHSYDGYMYMNDLGYTGNAVICVTHSFPCKNEHIDIAAEWSLVPHHMRSRLVEILNEHCNYDLYNKVITLCDALADADGFTTLERRLISVGLRHGTTSHTSLHWKGFYAIKKELEALIGKSIYTVLPDVEKSIYEDIEY